MVLVNKIFLDFFRYVKIKQKFKIVVTLVLSILSLIVLSDEVTLFLSDKKYSIIGYLIRKLVFDDPIISYYKCMIFTFCTLGYILFCVFYGFFKLKIYSMYGLYDNHHTSSSSLLFTSINFSRVSGPICFNYLDIINYK